MHDKIQPSKMKEYIIDFIENADKYSCLFGNLSIIGETITFIGDNIEKSMPTILTFELPDSLQVNSEIEVSYEWLSRIAKQKLNIMLHIAKADDKEEQITETSTPVSITFAIYHKDGKIEEARRLQTEISQV